MYGVKCLNICVFVLNNVRLLVKADSCYTNAVISPHPQQPSPPPSPTPPHHPRPGTGLGVQLQLCQLFTANICSSASL